MKKFKSARGLKYHMNLHNGIADYQCEDCGKAFVTRQKLMNHRRAKHTFEKPYICKRRQPITFGFVVCSVAVAVLVKARPECELS